jgi:hypothetical protein
LEHIKLIEHLKTQDLGDRAFCEQVVSVAVENPQYASIAIREWSDDRIVEMIAFWLARSSRNLIAEPNSLQDARRLIIQTVDDEYDKIRSMSKEFVGTIQRLSIPDIDYTSLAMNAWKPFFASDALSPSFAIANSINSMVADAMQSTTAAITNMANGYTSIVKGLVDGTRLLDFSFPTLALSSFFDSLPSISSIVSDLSGALESVSRVIESEKRGRSVLDASGYLLLTAYYTPSAFRDFDQVPTRVRSAVITNALRQATVEAEFVEDLRKRFTTSSLLRKRWPIVDRAIHMHRNRDYYLSIPPLLAQFEGMLCDLLCARSLVKRNGDRYYVLDASGQQFKRNKNGGMIPINGLGSLVDNSGYQNHVVLQDFAGFISQSLCRERNAILHGRNVRYNKAKLSTSLIFLIATLVIEIESIEAPG